MFYEPELHTYLNRQYLFHVFPCRGEQHGEKMLSLISAIIEQSEQPLAVALATDAMAALCRTEVRQMLVHTHVFIELIQYRL